MNKVCFKCGIEKPIGEFYKHPMMGDGYLGKCKECAKYDVRKNRWVRRDYYIAYDKERSKNPVRIKKIGEREAHKRKATVAVSNAVRRGKLKKEPCLYCGAEKVEAHHTDYSKPLDVIWLCRKHHADWHRANGRVD